MTRVASRKPRQKICWALPVWCPHWNTNVDYPSYGLSVRKGDAMMQPMRTRDHKLAALAILVVLCGSGVLTGAPEALGQQTRKADLYALVVGVQKYKDPSNNRLSIQGTTELYDFLVERRNLFGNAKVALLTDEKATKENIEKVLKTELTKARKNDVVLIFLDGHGGLDPSTPDQYYFCPYDATGALSKTGVCVSDKRIFKAIPSERLLLLTGSCFSGGFLAGLARGRGPDAFFDFFGELKGRFGMSAARNDQVAWVDKKFGMNVFNFFVTKGLRGAADTSGDGHITIKELYDYVFANVVRETNNAQEPQLFPATGETASTTIYSCPTYSDKLEVDVRFFYETEDNLVKPLTDESQLKSGQHVAIAFKANMDCFVHIFWWDSAGQVGRLFPNPKLTEGSGEVKAGEKVWLPSKGGKHWYVLDHNPGYETVYFVASRERNPKLEELYEHLVKLGEKARQGAEGQGVAEAIEREINLMGFADYVVPVKDSPAYENKEKLFEEMESKIKVAGLDGFVRLRFKHDP